MIWPNHREAFAGLFTVVLNLGAGRTVTQPSLKLQPAVTVAG